jgi:hypothetical protein
MPVGQGLALGPEIWSKLRRTPGALGIDYDSARNPNKSSSIESALERRIGLKRR